jgi:gliding motility-associated-like protein
VILKQLFSFLLLLSSVFTIRASHIVGGELYYDFLGGNQYRITLKLFRDCNCFNCAAFAATEYVTITNSGGSIITQLGLPFPGSNQLSSVVNNPCLVTTDVCVEEAVYTGTVNLPPIGGGYNLMYQRCCRNITNNLIGDQGATFAAHIPGTDVVANSANSSPRFDNFPPIFICNNAPLIFDHSATDPDGNVLRYSLSAPFDGADPNCPDPSPNSQTGGVCPTIPGAYNAVIYQNSFSPINPLNDPPNSGVMRIDSVTGILTCTPNTQGQFIVGVQVDEYNNGVLIGSTTRDFQFNVVQCNIPIAAIPSNSIDPTTGIGVYTVECADSSITFNASIFNPPPTTTPLTVHWDFGIPNRTDDTSNLTNPSFVYPDTGTFLVTLIVSKEINGQGCYDTAEAIVKVYPVFFPGFEFVSSINSACLDVSLNLEDKTVSTSGSVTSWFWNFGDGTNSTQPNPTKQYSSPGTFPITLTVANARGCSGTFRDTAIIHPKPNADFDAPAVCENQPSLFNDASTISPGGITTYDWDFDGIGTSSVRSPLFSFPSTGSKLVRLIVVSDKGCSDTLFKAVMVNPFPTITASPKISSRCPFQQVQLDAQGGVSYVWFPSTGLDNPTSATPIATTDTSSIMYVVQGTDANGCSNKDSVQINVYGFPAINAGVDTSVCLSAGSFRDSVMLVATGGVTYVWSPTTGLSDATVFNPVSRPLQNTTYYVTGTDANGCVNVDSVNVYFLDPSLNLILENEKPICEGQDGSATVADQGSSSYLWSPATYVSNPTIFNPIFSPPATIQYVLRVNNYCYTKTDTVNIVVLDLPLVDAGNDTSIYRDSEVLLNGSTNGLDYYWFPGTVVKSPFELSTTATPENSQWYYLYALNAAGCVSVDSVYITVLPLTKLLLPTGFSPNGDGVNDVFRIARNMNIGTLKTFSVYNRWGQLVFQTNDVSQGWDGTYKGKLQPMGTYVWYIKALNKDNDEINESGNITLLH